MKGVIFIGLQASGKSSFFRQQFDQTHLRLNLDMLKTRHREQILFDACLASKQPCVIDNTNPTRAERQKYIAGFRQHRFEVTGYFFQSVMKTCLARNARREPQFVVPEVALKGTRNRLEMPSFSEGFDRLLYVSIVNNEFVVEEFKDEI